MPTIDYEDVFEKAEVGIALNDPETGTIGRVNEHYAELMGYRREELETMRIEEISADDPTFDQEAAMEKIGRALEGERQQFDWLFERRDGTRFWGEVVLKRTMLGETDRLLAFVREISDRKQYEQELEQKNQRLDEFASLVSHDLRNPLNVAAGRLELAREECASEHLAAVARAHARMDTLIEELLTLARAGEAVGETEPVQLPTLVERCWQHVETESAELDLRTDAVVSADRQRLQQLFENLLRNAVEHGGEAVTVAVGPLEDGFYVEDDGPGIAVDQREPVLEPGYTTTHDGTGFGLSIVEDIAEAHGWSLRVTEGEAGGARFEFTNVKPPDG